MLTIYYLVKIRKKRNNNFVKVITVPHKMSITLKTATRTYITNERKRLTVEM